MLSWRVDVESLGGPFLVGPICPITVYSTTSKNQIETRARSHDDTRSIAPGPCADTHAMVCCVAKASAPIPKFATAWGTLRCELWNRQDTSNSMTLVQF